MSSPVEAQGAPAARNPRRGPYQGLIPYTEEDAVWFFGRDAARAVVLDNLLAYRVSILFGSSGVGKSSLLRAGVVRQVRDEGRRRIAVGEAPEYAALHFSSWAEDPVAGLQAAIGGALRDLSPELADGLPEGGSLADTVAAAVLRVDGALLVILDQFEEYFLYHDADGPFVTQLARLLARRDTAASVLIAIREDSLAKLDALAAHMPGLLDNLVRIEHLDRAAARAAIVEPLELWNREQVSADETMQIEPELVEAVLDGVQIQDARVQTPYLQIVLTRLWDEERGAGSRALRLGTLEQLGGTERIVAEHVDNAIATLSPDEQAIAASVLRHLVTPSGTKIALRTSDLVELAGRDESAVTAVLERLTRQARILQAVGGERYEIYHDALAEPILHWRRRWQARQDRLRERRRNRVIAAVAAGLVLTVVVVATLAVLAWLGQRDADRQARDARAVALASASRDQVESQPDIALLLGLAGLRERDRFETRSSLIAARQAAGPEAATGIIRGHEDRIYAAAFLRGGRSIASAGADGRIIVADVATHRQLGRPLFSDPSVTLLSLAISPDDRFLVAGDEAGVIRLWDLATRRLLRSVRTRYANLAPLTFSPDGRVLASAGDESPIRLWDVPTLKPAGQLRESRQPFTFSIAFSPDGRTLARVGANNVVRRWSLQTRRRLPGSFGKADAGLVSVAFSPDGRTLATGGRGATLWNIATGRARAMIPSADDPAAGATVNNVVFSPDGTRLAAAGADGAARLWTVGSQRPLRSAMGGPTGELEGVAFSPDGRTVAAFGEDERVWLLDTSRAETLVHGRPTSDLEFEPTGRTLATASLDSGTVRFWDVRSGRLTRTSRIDVESTSHLVFGAGARRLATTDGDGKIAVWDPKTPAAVGTPLPGSGDGPVTALAVSSAGGWLAASDHSNAVTVWDLASRRQEGQRLGGHRSGADLMAFSPNGRRLATADDAGVRIWNLATKGKASLEGIVRHRDTISLAFSPDGRTLASGDGSGIIRLTRVVPGGTSGLLRGGAAVLDIAFGVDGRMLIVGDYAGAVRFWDVAERRQLGRPLEQQNPANHVALSPDGRTFAADGAGFSVRLWSHVIWRDKDELRDEVCDLVGTDLSRAEWEQYAAGVDYRRVCDR